MSIFRNIYKDIEDACFIWWKEMRRVVKDEGVLIFFIVVPLAYPLLYSWIYNNEVVRDVPVCVVDNSHSQLSRQFIRMCDASPDVHIKYYAQDLDEAKSLVSRQLVKGVYLIPSSFEADTYGMPEDATTVAVSAVVIASNDVADADVYNFLCGVFENLDDLAKVHDKANELSVEFASSFIGVPYHSGAVAYFADKGIEVPAE